MFYPLPFEIINRSREVTGRSLLGNCRLHRKLTKLGLTPWIESDSPYYWYWFVGVGYQGFETFPIPLKNVDGEPDDEDIVAGATIGGFTKIFVAAVDEYDTVRTATDKAVAFSKTFSDVLAHEIGHGPNSEGNDDHLEGGLMSAGDAAIDRDFSGPTLIRLRGSLKWSE